MVLGPPIRYVPGMLRALNVPTVPIPERAGVYLVSSVVYPSQGGEYVLVGAYYAMCEFEGDTAVWVRTPDRLMGLSHKYVRQPDGTWVGDSMGIHIMIHPRV